MNKPRIRLFIRPGTGYIKKYPYSWWESLIIKLCITDGIVKTRYF